MKNIRKVKAVLKSQMVFGCCKAVSVRADGGVTSFLVNGHLENGTWDKEKCNRELHSLSQFYNKGR